MSDASRNRVIVYAVVHGHLSIAAAARRYGLTRQWVSELVRRYRAGGDEALLPRSRRPRSSPNRVSDEVVDAVLKQRHTLESRGLDHGAESIAARLHRAGVTPPSTRTIWRILHAAGLVTPQPQKRPRSAMSRFEAALPNETWQSDFTHWALADGTDIEIISWLDDHSRYLLHCSPYSRVTGLIVVATFTAAGHRHGLPASTLTDNGMVYTTRFSGGRGANQFEQLLRRLHIRQKNGSPGHPQTQGKIERFHITLKRWLAAQPRTATLPELQTQLDEFTRIYNTERPHGALQRRTPEEAYTALPKATPAEPTEPHWRIREDIVDPSGKVTLRHAGDLRHLAIGRSHRGTRVLLLVHGTDTIVVNPATGEIIAEHTINPHRDYQPRKT
jgi:transposase InsO family protein